MPIVDMKMLEGFSQDQKEAMYYGDMMGIVALDILRGA